MANTYKKCIWLKLWTVFFICSLFIKVCTISAQDHKNPKPEKAPDNIIQKPDRKDGIELIDAVRKTMEYQSSILIQKEQVNVAKGANQSAGGDFDWRMETYVTQRKDNAPASSADYSTAVNALDTTETGIRFAKLFRQGFYIEPGYKYSGYDYDLVSNQKADPLKTGNVSLVFRIPLLQGLGYENVGYREISSVYELEAARHNLKHEISSSIHNTVQAFWGYLAANEQLAVYIEAEDRARSILEKTEALVKANEAPAAEIINVRANLADKESARMSAEQNLNSARARLGTAMGIPSAETLKLPVPSGGFPLIDVDTLRKATSGNTDAYSDVAMRFRQDLMAVKKQNQSLDAQLKAARNRTKPQLNLELSIGYDGVRRKDSFSNSLQTIEYNQSDPDWSTGFRITCPIENNTAEGDLEQILAKNRQGSLQENELVRSIKTQINLTQADLISLSNEIQRSEEAVSSYTKAITNEREKYLMGETTILGLLYIEDRRDGAFVNRISVRLKAATALARLRYEMGSIVSFSDDAGQIDPVSFTSLSVPDQ